MVINTMDVITGPLEENIPGRGYQPSICSLSRMAKSLHGLDRTQGNSSSSVIAAKVLISGPGRLDTMSMTLHTNNELNDAYENCAGRRVKRNRVVHFIANTDTVTRW